MQLRGTGRWRQSARRRSWLACLSGAVLRRSRQTPGRRRRTAMLDDAQPPRCRNDGPRSMCVDGRLGARRKWRDQQPGQVRLPSHPVHQETAGKIDSIKVSSRRRPSPSFGPVGAAGRICVGHQLVKRRLGKRGKSPGRLCLEPDNGLSLGLFRDSVWSWSSRYQILMSCRPWC